MIILDSTSRSIKIVLDAAKTTNDMPVVVSYGERPQTTGIFVSNTKLTNSNGVTATEICAAPTASSLIREVFHISVQNADTASKTVTINLVDTSTSYPLFKSVMAAADQLIYTTNSGWQLFDSSGNLKQTISSYAGSTSQNFNAANLTVAGNTTLGDATTDTTNIGNGGIIKDSSGNTTIGGSLTLTSASGLGYATGAGGSVTQATSKSTSVTLNKPTGQITMNNAALAANTTVQFTLLNSLIAATDTVVITANTALVNMVSYNWWCATNGSGNLIIYVRNITAGSLSEAIIFNFSIIKGTSS